MTLMKISSWASMVLFLSACGMYGAGYPKPEYNYAGAPDDPVFYFESDFGVNTQFRAKINLASDEMPCALGQRVAYLQAMDSYYRDPDAKGPWKISAPADQPIVIAGQWSSYGSQSYSSLDRTKTWHPGASCQWVGKMLTPRKGASYRVRARNAGPLRCDMEITSMDGAAVGVQTVPTCQDGRR